MTERQGGQNRRECVYCGNAATTRDHIPPKCLFSKPRPALITVPSCRDCNLADSKDDEYLRFALSARHDTFEHPDVQAIFPNVWRGLRSQRRSGLRKTILGAIKEVPVSTPAGIYLGKMGAYDVDLGRLDRVVKRVVAGLFFRTQGRRLPSEFDAFSYAASGIRFPDKNAKARFEQSVDFALDGRHETIGRQVFSYWLNTFDAEPNISAVLISFYGKVMFFGGTVPREP